MVQAVKLSEIKPNPNNPRLIKDEKFAKLVKSIKEFPQMLELRPIVVNDDMIVLGGNMRLKACKEAGLKEVPIIKASSLTPEQQREFIIKDNVGFGEWDWELIANEWDATEVTDWGLDITGFEIKAEADGITDNVKRNYISFSEVNKQLRTKGIEYYSILRNCEMDLESLKVKEWNVLIFVGIMCDYINKNDVHKIISPPKGSRSEINGFHFATKLLKEVGSYTQIEVVEPFENRDNKIYIKDIYQGFDFSDFVIFDDIVTRGNTLEKMVSLTGCDKCFVLISNH